MAGPALSVVIPTLDDADALRGVLAGLAAQEGVALEAIVADGGSGDGTRAQVETSAAGLPFPVRWVEAPRGRGRQLNAGAAAARAPELLFLHADTELPGPDLLARARAHLAAARAVHGHGRVAGHFAVRFRRRRCGPSRAYYFFEAKTALDRPGCVNGDQGFWLPRAYFDALEGFAEDLPFLEDLRLAERVFATGVWTRLPGTVSTSARRFEAEGLRERQTLNALIRAAHAAGLSGFLAGAPGLYRAHPLGVRLDLAPFFAALQREMSRRRAAWRRVGDFTASQAWQLAFLLDCRRNRGAGVPPGDGPTPALEWFDRRLGAAVSGRVGVALATAAAWMWFHARRVEFRARGAPSRIGNSG